MGVPGPDQHRRRQTQCAVPWAGIGVCVFVLVLCAWTSTNAAKGRGGKGAYDWMTRDIFDEIDDRMNAVNALNCKSKPASELRLPAESVAQAPKFNRLLSYIVYPNR